MKYLKTWRKNARKSDLYNRANKRKQKQTSQRRILKGQKNRTERKEKVTKDYSLPTPRALERHILPRLGMGISGERAIDSSKYPNGILRKDRHLNIVILLFSNIETLISMSSEPESSKSLWMTTQLTLPSCLERVCMGNMVSRFQTLNKRQPWERSRTVSRPSIHLRFKNELALHYGFPSYACAAYRHSSAMQT